MECNRTQATTANRRQQKNNNLYLQYNRNLFNHITMVLNPIAPVPAPPHTVRVVFIVGRKSQRFGEVIVVGVAFLN